MKSSIPTIYNPKKVIKIPKYKCDYCKKIFEHPDAEGPKEGFAIACDDCYKCFQEGICYKCKNPVHPGFLTCMDHMLDDD